MIFLFKKRKMKDCLVFVAKLAHASFKKEEKVYLFCPAGALPLGVRTTLLPLHSSLRGLSCCPPGAFPLFVSHVNAAETGVATDETSNATDSATAIAASAANVTLFVIISAL
jgi:hypothetical protein